MPAVRGDAEGEEDMSERPCPDCGVKPAENHRPGCDVERCVLCGHQAISCGCYDDDDAGYDEDVARCGGRLPWTGEWPGDAECREFGWYAVLIPGRGWVSCDKDTPDAAEDLNRLATEARWSRTARRFVRR